MHDLVIRGGTIVDGTGAEPFAGDVAVDGDRITEVGTVDDGGRTELDADGAVVTPGFVDVHCHYDGQATWDQHLSPSTWHGVTSIVMGNCGVGFAPVHERDHDRLISLMEGVEDIPGTALHEGIDWSWETFGDFLDVLGERRFDADVGVLVPHGAVRLYVMGERGANQAAATDDEIVEMGHIVRDGVDAGAFGFSTSRTLNHRTSTGQHTPTMTAAASELVGIARAMAETGRGVFEVVSDYDDVDAEFDAFRQVAETGTRTFLSLNQNKGGAHFDVLDRIGRAVADGLPMTAQVAVRPIGVILGLQTTLDPWLLNPVWHEVRSADLDGKLRALRDPAFVDRLRRAAAEPGHAFADPARVFPFGERPDYEPPPEASVGAEAARRGVDPTDLLVELLTADGGSGLAYYPIFNYDDGDLEDQRRMLEDENAIIGLADGGAHVGTICDASFPTTMLAHWVRDRSRGPRFDLAWAVRAQTARTAEAFGLTDRGRIETGLRADLNVVDLDGLHLRRPELVADLPAGGRRLVQRADGYLATVVAGEVTRRDGEATGALPGRLLRSGR